MTALLFYRFPNVLIKLVKTGDLYIYKKFSLKQKEMDFPSFMQQPQHRKRRPKRHSMISNDEIRKEAHKANLKAEQYHQQRSTETARSFDELEFDYPLADEPIDPENSFVFINLSTYVHLQVNR